MRIVTRDGGWVVLAEWFGKTRVVFGPDSVYKCCHYVADVRKGKR